MTESNEIKLKTKTSRKLTRRERKALKTRQQILDAANELFENHPYDEVKMDDISERADLSRATLYNHFDSKEAIYFEIGIQSIKDIYERQKALIASEPSGLGQIVKLSELVLRNLFKTPLIHEIMRHYLVTNSKAEMSAEIALKKMNEDEDIENPSDKLRARYLKELRVFEKSWTGAIERGFEDGSIRQDLNSDQLVHFLFMIISGIVDRVHLERALLKKVNLSVDRIITRTIDLIRKDLARN